MFHCLTLRHEMWGLEIHVVILSMLTSGFSILHRSHCWEILILRILLMNTSNGQSRRRRDIHGYLYSFLVVSAPMDFCSNFPLCRSTIVCQETHRPVRSVSQSKTCPIAPLDLFCPITLSLLCHFPWRSFPAMVPIDYKFKCIFDFTVLVFTISCEPQTLVVRNCSVLKIIPAN